LKYLRKKKRKRLEIEPIDESQITSWENDDVDKMVTELMKESKADEKQTQTYWDCFACRKTFKSQQQWLNHENSKKHKKTLNKVTLAGKLTQEQLEIMEQQSIIINEPGDKNESSSKEDTEAKTNSESNEVIENSQENTVLENQEETLDEEHTITGGQHIAENDVTNENHKGI